MKKSKKNKKKISDGASGNVATGNSAAATTGNTARNAAAARNAVPATGNAVPATGNAVPATGNTAATAPEPDENVRTANTSEPHVNVSPANTSENVPEITAINSGPETAAINSGPKKSANTPNYTALAEVCQRLSYLQLSVKTSLDIAKGSNKYQNNTDIEELLTDIINKFTQYLNIYQGFMGPCPRVNSQPTPFIVYFNEIPPLIQYLQVLWNFLLVIPPWQNANPPIISQNNMTKFLPEIFLEDFQNAYSSNANLEISTNLENAHGNSGNTATSKNTPKNKKNAKNAKTLFLKKYFQNKDPLLNVYAYVQLDIMRNIALLLQILRKRNTPVE